MNWVLAPGSIRFVGRISSSFVFKTKENLRVLVCPVEGKETAQGEPQDVEDENVDSRSQRRAEMKG